MPHRPPGGWDTDPANYPPEGPDLVPTELFDPVSEPEPLVPYALPADVPVLERRPGQGVAIVGIAVALWLDGVLWGVLLTGVGYLLVG